MPEHDRIKLRATTPAQIGSVVSGQRKVSSVSTLIFDGGTARDYLFVKNLGSPSVYVRPALTVGTTTGEVLAKGEFAVYEGYRGPLRGITAGGTVSVYYEVG